MQAIKINPEEDSGETPKEPELNTQQVLLSPYSAIYSCTLSRSAIGNRPFSIQKLAGSWAASLFGELPLTVKTVKLIFYLEKRFPDIEISHKPTWKRLTGKTSSVNPAKDIYLDEFTFKRSSIEKSQFMPSEGFCQDRILRTGRTFAALHIADLPPEKVKFIQEQYNTAYTDEILIIHNNPFIVSDELREILKENKTEIILFDLNDRDKQDKSMIRPASWMFVNIDQPGKSATVFS